MKKCMKYAERTALILSYLLLFQLTFGVFLADYTLEKDKQNLMSR